MSKGDEAQEKVKFVEDLLATYESGIEPTQEQLELALEMGVDIEAMERVNEIASDYGRSDRLPVHKI